MAITINGTTGLAGDVLGFNTGGVERSRFDGNGNLLIGNTSYNAGAFGGNARGINVAGIQPQVLLHETDTDKDGYLGIANSQMRLTTADSIPITFATADVERMRITSGGSLCIGVDTTANSEKMRIDSTGSTGTVFLRHGSTDDVAMMIMRHSRNTGGTVATYLRFQDSGGSARGSIQVSTSGTSYNTGSDYRLKENITAISDGITRLKQLKPYRFNFKSNSSEILDGFFAHEAQAVVPECASGTKDEVVVQAQVDSEVYKESELGNPIYQGIDQSKLVPLLTAALQEAITEIESLKARLDAAGL